MDEGVIFRLVAPGEAAGVVAAYVRAVADAARVRELLRTAGVDAGSVLVVPSLSEACEPIVIVTALTPPARRSVSDPAHDPARSDQDGQDEDDGGRSVA